MNIVCKEGAASSERNKISKDDYIILKKKVGEEGTHPRQIEQENKFRVLDVKNEVPDAIKYRYISLGEIPNTSNILNTSLFELENNRPIIVNSTPGGNFGNPFPKELIFNKSNWETLGGQELINEFNQPDLYFSFSS